ncbi:MAG TPA: peptidase M16 [Rhodospirillaceae bacterium]|nr:peptidase M16 [Rhodospirillaceae bacterium]
MSVQITDLENGLRVVTERMDRVETVSVGAWVGVGARHEPEAVNGVSHLLEHMVFKGTKKRSARAIAEEIEAVGGHMNAYTAREHTAYYAKMLKEDLGLAMDVIGDLVQHATLDADELERERHVVIQEIHQLHDTPDDIVFENFQAVAFPDQALGRSVLGSEALIEGMSRDAVLDYMTTHYAAPVSVVSAAGALDHDRVVDMVRNTFADLPAGAPAAREAARYGGGDVRVNRDLEQVHITLGFEGLAYDDDDYYAASVLSALLGGGMSSRLFQEVREKRGLVYSIYSYQSAYADGGLFGVYAGTGSGEVTELMPLIADELNKVRLSVDEDEVARARAQLKASILMSLESTSSRCEQLARQMLIYGRPVPAEEIVAKVDAVTAGDVVRVAERLFSTKPTLSAIGPLANLEAGDTFAARLSA